MTGPIAARLAERAVSTRRYLVDGELTRVRFFTRRDVDRWVTWANHTDPLYRPYNPAQLAHWRRDGWYDDLVGRQKQMPYAVDSLDGRMIGRIFLRFVNRAERSAVLGIDFDAGFVGRGYGSDALQAFLGYFFGRLGFRRMLLTVASYNLRARACYERCGFRYVSSHWNQLKLDVDVLNDPRWREVRPQFRRARWGTEALFHVMEVVSDPPA